ncbi:MAG TPA: hypothetical protein VMF58_11600 [Rhizomicrobium sp.]|nr:hypothetical protein [Rhizomicrobium sp.]
MDFTRLTSLPDIDGETQDDGSDGSAALREALAVLDAISFGELFAALPTNPADRVRHQTGIELLEMLRGRLKTSVRGGEI